MKKFIICAILILLMVSNINGAVEGKEIKFKARISFCNWNDRRQCPNKKTASGLKPIDGYVAASPDIIKKYKLEFGQPIYIEGYGKVELQCRTGDFYTKGDGTKVRITNTFDIYKGKNVWRCWMAEVTIVEWE
jgi:hypothetical protein